MRLNTRTFSLLPYGIAILLLDVLIPPKFGASNLWVTVARRLPEISEDGIGRLFRFKKGFREHFSALNQTNATLTKNALLYRCLFQKFECEVQSYRVLSPTFNFCKHKHSKNLSYFRSRSVETK